MRSQKVLVKLDKAGMTASTACAVHCALVPLIVSVLPLWGLSFLAEEWIEQSMICLAVFLGSVSLGLAYYRHHRRLWPLATLLTGFAAVFAGHFIGSKIWEPILIPCGGFIIALAHYLNWRFTRSCLHNQPAV